MEGLNIGSVVRLKSGGPKMTVVDRSPSGRVLTLAWFDEGNTWRTVYLHRDACELVTGNERDGDQNAL